MVREGRSRERVSCEGGGREGVSGEEVPVCRKEVG